MELKMSIGKELEKVDKAVIKISRIIKILNWLKKLVRK